MLIVIDMQLEFSSSEAIVGPVCEAIIKAKANNEPIILVEYACDYQQDKEQCRAEECQCMTHTEILDLLDGYSNVVYVAKAHDDGGREIINAVEVFPPIVDVCGVNTNACVRETVETLAKRVPETEFVLLLEACNSSWYGQAEDSHAWVDKCRNVRRNISRAA